MNVRNIAKLIVAVLGTEAAGAVGALVTAPAIPTWYAGLHKPALNPPAWVFGPVWTTLYLLMGIAAFLVWRRIDQYPGVKGNGIKLSMNKVGVSCCNIRSMPITRTSCCGGCAGN